MTSAPGAAGFAALAICESLLLSLTENNLIETAEARAILEDAATTERNVPPTMTNAREHQDAAKLIETILGGADALRLP